MPKDSIRLERSLIHFCREQFAQSIESQFGIELTSGQLVEVALHQLRSLQTGSNFEIKTYKKKGRRCLLYAQK